LKLDYERKAEKATPKGSKVEIHDPVSGKLDQQTTAPSQPSTAFREEIGVAAGCPA